MDMYNIYDIDCSDMDIIEQYELYRYLSDYYDEDNYMTRRQKMEKEVDEILGL